MWTLMAFLALAAAMRAVVLQRELSCQQLVCRSGFAGIAVELRRRAMVYRADGDSQEFPQPRERRTLVLRLAGAPVFCRREEIGLPPECDARLGLFGADDFDSAFTGRFRAATLTGPSHALAGLWRA